MINDYLVAKKYSLFILNYSLYRHDFFFFGGVEGFDLCDIFIVGLLHVPFGIFLDVLAQAVLDEFLKLFNRIAAGVTVITFLTTNHCLLTTILSSLV